MFHHLPVARRVEHREHFFGSLHALLNHTHGYEWCVNAPAVDANGKVYVNSEDGNVYVIAQGGKQVGKMFLQSAVAAAYTPLAIGPDGKIYAENNGNMFVLGP